MTDASRVLGRTPVPRDGDVARILASAALGAPTWTRPDLVRALAGPLGARRRWIGPLVDEMLAAFPRAPARDSVSLEIMIAASEPLASALARGRERGRPVRIAVFPVGTEAEPGTKPEAGTEPDAAPLRPPADGSPRTADPPPATHAALAALLGVDRGELDWFADTRDWNRRIASGPLQHYRHEWRDREARTPRLIEVPGRRLRELQRILLDGIIGALPVHDAAHGFVRGRGVVTGARLHAGAAVVISLDLTTFFARIDAGRVRRLLGAADVPDAVAWTIAGLCTHATPIRTLSRMPRDGSPEERHALRGSLTRRHLPQGAPTSPALANASLLVLDRRLHALAVSVGARYTRYADDLTLSGGDEVARRVDAIIRSATRVVESEGHRLNERKTRVRRAGSRQTVTGVVVNEHLAVSRRERDELRAILHNAVRTSGPAQNRSGHPDFRSHLLGRIAWVAQARPEHGEELRRALDRIDWGS